jgi:hypothetical protein
MATVFATTGKDLRVRAALFTFASKQPSRTPFRASGDWHERRAPKVSSSAAACATLRQKIRAGRSERIADTLQFRGLAGVIDRGLLIDDLC